MKKIMIGLLLAIAMSLNAQVNGIEEVFWESKKDTIVSTFYSDIVDGWETKTIDVGWLRGYFLVRKIDRRIGDYPICIFGVMELTKEYASVKRKLFKNKSVFRKKEFIQIKDM